MNQTWMAPSSSDNTGPRYDYNTFLHADLFFNGTFNDVSNDINVIYQSLFASSTLVSPYYQNQSDGNLSSFIHISDAHGISTPLGKLILTFLMSTMAFLTVAGNSLVILAFLCEPTIRTYSNYFILNLSIADLLIGLICIPLYAHKIILGEWHLGYILCKFWLVFDYVVGSASTLCIVVISYDRYQMVSKGLNYISKTKIQRALKFMFATWIVATLNYGPAIILWDWVPGTDPFQTQSCDPPFANNFPYLVTTAFVEFFVPFFSITTLNLLVYMNIRQRSRGLVRTNESQSSGNGSLRGKSSASIPLVKIKPSSSENGFSEKNHHNDDVESLSTNSPLPTTTTFSKSSSAALARDRKAAKNLFIFVFVFSICWCPYTFLTLIRALCKNPDKCISSLVYEVTFWLLWVNSTINPILYSFLHVKFRKAFYRILCFYRLKYQRSVRMR